MGTSNNVLLLSPMEIRGDLACNWQFFKEQWENCITITESAGKDESIKAAFAPNSSNGTRLPQGIKINLSSTESQDSKSCLQALENYFKPAKNKVCGRFKFHTCDQGPNELVDQWLTRLRHLSQPCNFGATLDSMLTDCLILGTKDKKAQAHLFREKKLI